MKELFKLLTDREKRALSVLAGGAVLFLLVFLFVSLGALRSYDRSEASLTRLTTEGPGILGPSTGRIRTMGRGERGPRSIPDEIFLRR